jgi:5-methylcytosine-specific restriction protein A
MKRSFDARLPIPAIQFEAKAKSQREREQGTHCGWKWRRFRNAVLMRSPLCVDCGRLGEEVHHLVPRSRAPELMYDAANVVVLCSKCHEQRHR